MIEPRPDRGRPARSRIEWREVNGIVALDKPVGMTSNRALQVTRRLFRARKAGHTGSLDPLASGLLPLINPDGLVVMDIAQLVESFGGNVTIQNVGEVPVTRRREANAKVAVKSGETIVLGGFISADKSYNDSGVPFLKDIPGLGILFRGQSERKNRQELMIFIKPTVLETPEIAARVAMEEKDKMPGILGAERELTEDYNKAMQKVSEEAGVDYQVPATDLEQVK